MIFNKKKDSKYMALAYLQAEWLKLLVRERVSTKYYEFLEEKFIKEKEELKGYNAKD